MDCCVGFTDTVEFGICNFLYLVADSSLSSIHQIISVIFTKAYKEKNQNIVRDAKENSR